MRFDVDHVRAKLERARHHIAEARKIISQYQQLFPPIVAPHPISGKPAVAAHFGTPDDLALILGDAANNARAAFDWVAVAVAKRFNCPTEKLFYPLGKDSENYKRRLFKSFQNIPDDVTHCLEGFETYLGGRGEHVFHLNEIVRLDKHHEFIPALQIISFDQIIFERNGEQEFALRKAVKLGSRRHKSLHIRAGIEPARVHREITFIDHFVSGDPKYEWSWRTKPNTFTPIDFIIDWAIGICDVLVDRLEEGHLRHDQPRPHRGTVR